MWNILTSGSVWSTSWTLAAPSIPWSSSIWSRASRTSTTWCATYSWRWDRITECAVWNKSFLELTTVSRDIESLNKSLTVFQGVRVRPRRQAERHRHPVLRIHCAVLLTQFRVAGRVCGAHQRAGGEDRLSGSVGQGNWGLIEQFLTIECVCFYIFLPGGQGKGGVI